ncbi:MAG: hypothetical protein R2706_18395 [Acidimicrobiales bacterium]
MTTETGPGTPGGGLAEAIPVCSRRRARAPFADSSLDGSTAKEPFGGLAAVPGQPRVVGEPPNITLQLQRVAQVSRRCQPPTWGESGGSAGD